MNIFANIKKGIDKLLGKHDNVCAYHKSFALIAESASGGLFLSQLYFWCDKGSRADGYIFKTYQQWYDEIHISLSEWDRAKTFLKEIGVIDYRRFGTDPKLYYRINFDVLAEKLTQAIEKMTNKPQKNSMFEVQISELEKMADKVAETLENFPMLNSGLGNSEYRNGQIDIDHWASDNTGLGIAESGIGSIYRENEKENTKRDYYREGEAPTPKNDFCENFLEDKNTTQVTTVEKPKVNNSSDCSLAVDEWKEFEWVSELYQEYRPKCWRAEWMPFSVEILNSLKANLVRAKGDVMALKEMIISAFARVENKPSLWDYSIEWVLRPQNLATLAWEGASNLYAPSHKCEQQMKQSMEMSRRIEKVMAGDTEIHRMMAKYSC